MSEPGKHLGWDFPHVLIIHINGAVPRGMAIIKHNRNRKFRLFQILHIDLGRIADDDSVEHRRMFERCVLAQLIIVIEQEGKLHLRFFIFHGIL